MAALLLASNIGLCGDCCPEPDLTVFFTSDTRGMLRRCGCAEGQMGGLSARASYIKTHGPRGKTLVLDAGDTFFPGLEVEPEKREFYAIKAETMARAMAAAGYAAAAVGEFDLAYGPGFLLDTAKHADFPFLCANASWERGGKFDTPFDGSAVVEAGGARIGVAGVLGSGFPYPDFRGNFGEINVSDPLAAARKEIDRLRDEVDLVLVLTHLAVESPEELAGALKGADIVIQGHSNEQMNAPVVMGGTLLVKGYMLGKHMGRLDLWLEHDPERLAAGKRLAGFEFSVVALDESIPPDKEVESLIAGYREKLKERMFVFEKPDPEGAGAFAGPDECGRCHPDAYADWSETRHSRAFSSLEATSDQYDPECLPCHTTGFGSRSGYRTGEDDKLVNVTCESCHGRGSGHVAEKSGWADKRALDVVAREVPEDKCRSCHDEENSPNFDYGLYLDMGGAHRGAKSEVSPHPVVPLPRGEGHL